MTPNAADTAAARALLDKAIQLDESSQREEAIGIYDQIIARFVSSAAPGLREVVALALFNKGRALFGLDRHEETVAAFGQFIDYVEPGGEGTEANRLCRAMYLKGFALYQLDRHQEGIGVLDRLVDLFGGATEVSCQRLVAAALNLKGHMLAWASGFCDSCAVYDQVVQRFGMSRDPGLQEHAATALLRVALNLQGGFLCEFVVPPEAVYNKGFDTELRPELLERMVRARTGKNVPTEVDCQKAVLSAFDEVGERFGDSVHPGVRKVVAAAMVHKGGYLGMLERHGEAIAAYDSVIQCSLNEMEPALYEPVADAMLKKAVLLHKLQRNGEAIEVCDQLVGRFGTEAASRLRDKVKEALACKEECVEVLSQLVKEFQLKWRIGIRTATFIVHKITKRFASKIQVCCGKHTGDGKELFDWLALGWDPEHEKIVVVDGDLGAEH